MSIEISSLNAKKQQIAKLCDSKSNGGNGDGTINNNEINIFTAAVQTMTDSGFSLGGKNYSFENTETQSNNILGNLFSARPSFGSSKIVSSNTKSNAASSSKETGVKKDSNSNKGSNSEVGNAEGFSSKYDDQISKYAEKYDVDPNLVKAIMRAESSFDPNATSSCNCQGLMQVNPKYNSGNLYDVDTNINAGCKILSQCLDAFDGDVSKALMGYNQGIGGANKSIKNGTTSTSYSKKVLEYYNQLTNKKLDIAA